MQKKTLIFLIAALFFMPMAVLASKGQVNFHHKHNTTKQEHVQKQKNTEFDIKKHQANLNFIKERLKNSLKLTEVQIKDLTHSIISFSTKKYKETVAFFDRTIKNFNMTYKQIKNAIKHSFNRFKNKISS